MTNSQIEVEEPTQRPNEMKILDAKDDARDEEEVWRQPMPQTNPFTQPSSLTFEKDRTHSQVTSEPARGQNRIQSQQHGQSTVADN